MSDLISRQTIQITNRIEHEQITIFYATGAVPPEKNCAVEPKQAVGAQSQCNIAAGERQIENRNCRAIAGRQVERKPLDKLVSN